MLHPNRLRKREHGILPFRLTVQLCMTEATQCPGPRAPNLYATESGYPPPPFPRTSSGCKQKAVDAFPGKIETVGFVRKCDDPGSTDHYTGIATDPMASGGGVLILSSVAACVWQQFLSLAYPTATGQSNCARTHCEIGHESRERPLTQICDVGA